MLLTIIVGACSQYSRAPLSVGFHNLNAKYNALFQAQEKMAIIEKQLFDNRQENYTQLLPILLPLDSTAASAEAEALTSVIKKASMVVERHQNSKWLDQAYYLIGKARLMKEDYANALETFKYINTTATDPDARHAALIGLMRTYIEQKAFPTALRVAELLREAPLNKDNTVAFYLTKAYLHQQRREFALALAIVEQALPLLSNNEQKARLIYTTAQLYEVTGQTEKAIKKYALSRKGRASFELRFYASLNEAILKGERLALERMLKDPKNAEVKDKIYSALADLALQNGNKNQGLALLKNATASSKDPRQLATTYLHLADMYYQQLGQYEQAYAYYDSCLTVLSPQDKVFTQVKEKHNALASYVKQANVIVLEDSLQKLAKLPMGQVDFILDNIIRANRAKEAARMQQAPIGMYDSKAKPNANTSTQQLDWYFSNPMAVSQGQAAFLVKWGSRALEDNWRRSSRDDATLFGATANTPNAGLTTTNASSSNSPNDGDWAVERSQMKSKIPFTPQALDASNRRKEQALFELGKVCKLQLNEPQRAIQTFEKLLQIFPTSTYEAETLYLLCLLYDNQSPKETYQKRLFEQYPDSYFARLLKRNAAQPLSSDKETVVQNMYEKAFTAYQQGQYTDASVSVEKILQTYPSSKIEDKVVFLKALLVAKLQNKQAYILALDNFVKDFPKSSLLPLVKEYLAAANLSSR